MEVLTLTRKAWRLPDNEVYCEWRPANEGVEDAVMHGMTFTIEGSISATLDAYETTAHNAILLSLEQLYPGFYS